MTDIILASKSPRRRELFRKITPMFKAISVDVDESAVNTLNIPQTAVSIARMKADAAAALYPDACVVGCDTVVELDGRLLGKPRSKDEARAMLKGLSGRAHTVHTGVCILHGGRQRQFAQSSTVVFYPLSDGEIERYISTDEPYDKAGGYGIQDLGALLVARIDGDYFNVMGLPVARLYRELVDFGLEKAL